MKKQIYFLVSLFALIGFSMNAKGQGTAIAPQTGSQFTYSINGHTGSSYVWTLTKGATYPGANASGDVSVKLDGGGNYSFGNSETEANGGKSIKITWISPDISETSYYYLTVVETGTNSCQNIKSIAIRPVNSFKLFFVTTVNETTDNPKATNYPVCSTNASVVSFGGDVTTTAKAKEFVYDYGETYMTYHITAQNITNTQWKAVIKPTLPGDYSTAGRVKAYYGTYAAATGKTGTAVNGGSALTDGTPYELTVAAGTNDIYVTFVVDNTLPSENLLTSMGLEGTTEAKMDITLESSSAAGTTYQYPVTDVNDLSAKSATESHTVKSRPATAITTP